MTAGRGIVHSERTDDARRKSGQRLHGIQSWVALPDDALEIEPSFHHHPKETLPVIRKDGAEMRLIAGAAFGASSPVKTFSPMFYLGIEAAAGARIVAPDEYEERALYVLDGDVSVDGEVFSRGAMIVFTGGASPVIDARTPLRAMLFGGESPGARIIWWNLVSTTKDRIDRAKRDWRASADSNFKDSVFRLPPGEEEFIPLPDN
jgi:redox-sensitive bicupin YhaK (pirin superfamily)